jgi:Transglutaminase-like superfamily
VDADTLSRVWTASKPHAGSAMALQAAWLASRLAAFDSRCAPAVPEPGQAPAARTFRSQYRVPIVSVGSLPARLSLSDKARLAIEIMATYARVMWLLRRDELPGTIARLRASPHGGGTAPPYGNSPPFGDSLADARRLGRAVVRTLAPLPRGSHCLTRSLVLLSLLARRGMAVDLVIAVQPSADPSFDAHAWVEVDGSPLLAPALDYGRLVTL